MSQVYKPHTKRRLGIATAVALAVIVWGALFLIAPVWQFPKAAATYNPPFPIASVEGHVSRTTLLDVNTASAQELEALPGIGPAKAASIVAYREEHGPFDSLAQLDRVSGITSHMVDTWSDLATAVVPKASRVDHE